MDSLESIAEALATKRSIVITAHVNADGDAIGSSLGLARALTQLGKSARVVLTDFAQKYRFLDSESAVEVVSTTPPDGIFDGCDAGVLLDASDPRRIGALERAFFAASMTRLCVDHHLEERRPEFDLHCIRPDAAATGSLVLELAVRLAVDVDVSIADPLFVAVATDTGWFRFSNTTGTVLREAAALIDAGADPERLYTHVYENVSHERLRLQALVIERARAELDGAFLWAALPFDVISSCGVPRSDFEGLIDPLRSVSGTRVVAFLTESEPASWKVSLRSRGNANVQRVAVELGGGGHAKAAGGRVDGTLERAVERLRAVVAAELARAPDEGL